MNQSNISALPNAHSVARALCAVYSLTYPDFPLGPSFEPSRCNVVIGVPRCKFVFVSVVAVQCTVGLVCTSFARTNDNLNLISVLSDSQVTVCKKKMKK